MGSARFEEFLRAGLVIYIENAGDFTVPFQAIEAVHSQKVIFERTKLHRRIREAIRHAHDAEDPSVYGAVAAS
jgi:hypothetical protein